jgi:hypothetical protein
MTSGSSVALEGDPAELEEPRRQAGEQDDRAGDEAAPGAAQPDNAEREDRCEHRDAADGARHTGARPRHAEHRSEHVDEDRALVVVEGDDVERQEAAVLVAQALRDRERVVGERRLVADEPGRVRREEPQVERDHGHDDAERCDRSRTLDPRAGKGCPGQACRHGPPPAARRSAASSGWPPNSAHPHAGPS